jgi:surfactin synthase thioesterase subunit
MQNPVLRPLAATNWLRRTHQYVSHPLDATLVRAGHGLVELVRKEWKSEWKCRKRRRVMDGNVFYREGSAEACLTLMLDDTTCSILAQTEGKCR